MSLTTFQGDEISLGVAGRNHEFTDSTFLIVAVALLVALIVMRRKREKE
jgi:hypothetical protein